MQQRDLLKDQIEQIGKTLGKVIARFLDLKNRSSIEKAIIQTNTALKDKLDIDIPVFLDSTDEEAKDLILAKMKTTDNVEQLANYLIELGDQSRALNTEKALLYYRKALSLYELISNITQTFSFDRSKNEYALRLKMEQTEKH